MANLPDLHMKLTADDAISPALKGVASTLGTVATVAAASVAAVSALGVGLAKVALAAADYAEQNAVAAEAAGFQRKTYEELTQLAGMYRISQDQLSTGLAKFNVSLGAAFEGQKKQVELFANMGVAIHDVNGNARSAEDVFYDFAQAVSNLDNKSVAAKAGFDAFSRGTGPRFVAFLREQGDALRDNMQAMSDTGRVVDELSQEKLLALDGAMDNLTNRVRASSANMVAYLTPFFTSAIEGLDSLIGKLAQATTSWFRMFEAGTAENRIRNLQKTRDELEDVSEDLASIGRRLQNNIDVSEEEINKANDRYKLAMERYAAARAAMKAADDAFQEELRNPSETSVAAGAVTPFTPEDKDKPPKEPKPPKFTERELWERDWDKLLGEMSRNLAVTQGEINDLFGDSADDAETYAENYIKVHKKAWDEIKTMADEAADRTVEGLQAVIGGGFEGGLKGARNALGRWLLDIIADIASARMKQSLTEAFTDLLSSVGGNGGTSWVSLAGTFLGALVGGGPTSTATSGGGNYSLDNFGPNMLHAAEGATFTVPGTGSSDNVVPIFRAMPGEEVSIGQPSSKGAMSITMHVSVDARGAGQDVDMKIRNAIRIASDDAVARITNKVRKNML